MSMRLGYRVYPFWRGIGSVDEAKKAMSENAAYVARKLGTTVMSIEIIRQVINSHTLPMDSYIDYVVQFG